jgi:hypothetical protein
MSGFLTSFLQVSNGGTSMRVVKRYSLIKAGSENQRSVLARDGKVLNIEVEGSILEVQLELEDKRVMIWFTDNSPYDEGLHVYLLDEHDTILDALEAGADFTPGILKIAKIGEDWVEFKFFSNNNIYRLEVTKAARFRVLLPAGWKYKKWFSLHRLIVHEMQTGENL